VVWAELALEAPLPPLPRRQAKKQATILNRAMDAGSAVAAYLLSARVSAATSRHSSPGSRAAASAQR
jgi:hypothetical protein